MKYVLDASALLALIQKESGHDKVSQALPWAIISAVNLSEVVAKLAEKDGVTNEAIWKIIDVLDIATAPFDEQQSFIAGLLRPETRALGLSLGDRACLSLAIQKDLTVLTADQAWLKLSLGVKIQTIR